MSRRSAIYVTLIRFGSFGSVKPFAKLTAVEKPVAQTQRRDRAMSRRSEAASLKSQGLSVREIADKMGIQARTVAGMIWQYRNLDAHRELQRKIYQKSPAFGRPPRFWSQEEDDVLRKCVAKRMSAALIGIGLGRTRNSVIGRAQRLGIELNSRPKVIAPRSTHSSLAAG